MKIYKNILALLSAVLLMISFSPAHAESVFNARSKSEHQIQMNIAGASHRDTLQLLLAGQGKIAQEKPEVVNALGFDPKRPVANAKVLNQIIDLYLEYSENYPGIHNQLTSGDPDKVYSALLEFNEDFKSFSANQNQAHSVPNKIGYKSPQDFCGRIVCGAAVVVVAATGVVYTHVALATAAVGTIAIVTWYLTDKNSTMMQFEKDEVTAKLTKAMAS